MRSHNQTPNPLPVDLWGYAPDDGADFLRHLTDECADAGIAIKEIRVDPAHVHQLVRNKTQSGCTLWGIDIKADTACRGRIEVR